MQRGMIRKVDSQSRVTVPIEFLNLIGLKVGDSFRIDVDGKGIVVVPYKNGYKKLDVLRRIVIPSTFRKDYKIKENQDMEIRCFDNCVYISLVGAELPASLE